MHPAAAAVAMRWRPGCAAYAHPTSPRGFEHKEINARRIDAFSIRMLPATAAALLSMALAANYTDYYAQIQPGTTPAFLDNYSAFKVFAGLGPYSPRRSSGIPNTIPSGYELDQVVMFHRHGERYPDADNSQVYQASLDLIEERTATPDEYSFLNSWTYFANDSNLGTETTTGPFAGIQSSKEQGEWYLERYSKLIPDFLRIWSSSSGRVNATAHAFAEGFFQGRDDLYKVIIVDEEKHADSLTPKCKGPQDTTCSSLTTYTPEFDEAAARINNELGTRLANSDVQNIMEVALFEVNVRGDSPWLDVFTPEEWLALEYVRSYRLFCKRAHGSPKGMASGSVLTNATATLFSEGPGENQALSFVFVHDTQISQIIGAAGLLNQSNLFDANRVVFGNQIQISDAVPMGASINFERFSNETDTFVRVLLNQAILPIDWCSSGPGYSCPLDQFIEGLDARYEAIGWEKNCAQRHKKDPTSFNVFWE